MKVSKGNLIPDLIINTLYKRIKSKIKRGENYDHYMRVFTTLNCGVIPKKILNLIK